MAMPRKKCSCGRWFYAQVHDVCKTCHTSAWQQNSDAKSPYFPKIAKHEFGQTTDREVCQMLNTFVRAIVDLGPCSPVTHYSCGVPASPGVKAIPPSPGFLQMAAQYGGLPCPA